MNEQCHESLAVKALREGNDILQIKPTIFGIGININALLAKLIPKPRPGQA
jgi:hypothetical protein